MTPLYKTHTCESCNGIRLRPPHNSHRRDAENGSWFCTIKFYVFIGFSLITLLEMCRVFLFVLVWFFIVSSKSLMWSFSSWNTQGALWIFNKHSLLTNFCFQLRASHNQLIKRTEWNHLIICNVQKAKLAAMDFSGAKHTWSFQINTFIFDIQSRYTQIQIYLLLSRMFLLAFEMIPNFPQKREKERSSVLKQI